MALKKSQKKAVAVGAGLAGLAAAAAGVYFLTGKNSKNRKKVAVWASKMQKEVVGELNKAQKASKENYHKIVDNVAKNYKQLKSVSPAELAAVAAQMKGSWNAIQGEIKSAVKTVRKVVPKAVKSKAKKVAVKRVVKKVAKKAAPKKKTGRK